jgi:catechol-2,3-dioxygenase
MTSPVISEIGYVAMHTRDLETALGHSRDVLGLVETDRTGNAVFLGSRARAHHELVYLDSPVDALGHVGLVAPDAQALDTVRSRVKAEGLTILTETPLHPGVADGFSFIGPERFIFEIYIGMRPVTLTPISYGPDRFGHVNLHPRNLQAMLDFFIRVLDFKVSDIIGDDFAYFLRCNPEHHGVALIKGRGWMHHHAWQMQSIAELGKAGDRLQNAGGRLLMGPVRHGAGHNIAVYYVEPTGAVVELYTDMEYIFDANRPPIIWDRDDRSWSTLWAGYDATEFRSHGLFPADEPIIAG